ncbi:MAG TPA: hypothetical protein VFM63_08580 [Pyrinomonadaceae bacterium]|nr:hypothetical protein [Pyrinomonadaceae bacterium]
MIRASLLVLLPLAITVTTLGQAQKKPSAITSPLCTRRTAIENTRQQILFTRTFDQVGARIAVLLRSAHLLWPYEQDKALAAFMEAFDLATQNFKEQGDQVRRSSESQFALRMQVPDQRYKVIAALAKRDPAAASKLSEQMLKDETREAEEKPTTDDNARRSTADKLLAMASGLVETDQKAAINFAHASLRYPATLALASFLYKLANVNQVAGDQFYLVALATYKTSPMDQFLYLSAYPFGNNRDAGEMPTYTLYRVPEGFVRSADLQLQFVEALLARAQNASEVPGQKLSRGLSDTGQMWIALSRLEKQIEANLPQLFESAVQTREKLYALLNPAMQKNATGAIARDNPPKKSFDEQVEEALKLADVDRRDQGLTFAVLHWSNDATEESVVNVIDKISDSSVRNALTNWFFFFRTQALIDKKQLDEARRTASKVVELDQRAYLFSRLAEKSLAESEDQTQAREMLNEIADAGGKAPKTIVTARALLALAHLYAKIDVNRGVEELGKAVKTINAIESPDFSSEMVTMKIEGKTFGAFGSYSTPGFNPENAFSEMGKVDFDGSLMQATTFTDKSLRALTTLAVIEPCFEVAPKTKKAK